MINWKLRFQNKTTLLAICLGIVSLVYQIMKVAGVTYSVSEQAVIDIVGMVVNVLVLLGVVVDPTTEGISDSKLAMTYDKPKEDGR